MTLTPRIELVADGKTYTSLVDLKAKLTVSKSEKQIAFAAAGQLLTTSHQPVHTKGVDYRLNYVLSPQSLEITANTTGAASAPTHLIVPVIATSRDTVTQVDAQTVRIDTPKGSLRVHTDTPKGFEAVPTERTFNLVPGFECVPLSIILTGDRTTVRIETD